MPYENLHCFGDSTAWHRSWVFWQTRPKFLCDFVLFGYGVRIKALATTKHYGMLSHGWIVLVYWNWRPHPSWVKANTQQSQGQSIHSRFEGEPH